MKLAAVKINGKEQAAVVNGNRTILVQSINRIEKKDWSTDLFDLIKKQQLKEVFQWYKEEGGENKLHHIPAMLEDEVHYGPLYRHPEKILGIGMNYLEKAIELSGKPPEEEPVIFMKPHTSLIGPDEEILLTPRSTRITAEAELSIVIGEQCKDVEEADVPQVVAGFTTSLDMTAQDINQSNPRFLQRSKSFDTFFSFGPYLITIDEFPIIEDIKVETILNEEVYHSNVVAHMMFHPWYIVSFFSKHMTLYPGDIIMTGTPGSVIIREGDIVEAQINGFKNLSNPVSSN